MCSVQSACMIGPHKALAVDSGVKREQRAGATGTARMPRKEPPLLKKI